MEQGRLPHEQMTILGSAQMIANVHNWVVTAAAGNDQLKTFSVVDVSVGF